MSRLHMPDRRTFLISGAAAVGSLALSGCDRLSSAPWFRDILYSAEELTRRAQRAIVPRVALAREFSEADLSPSFRPNGTTFPETVAYERLAASDFADWRLAVAGLVDRPLELSMAELRALPARTQITRHDCVEGWSCIGKWTGPPLAAVLDLAGLKPNARYVVFHCADNLSAGFLRSPYYESIDLIDAFHPQTILAYEMNDETLPIRHGAPLRLRVERQLGYKMAKYVMRIEAADSLAGFGDGRGGFWEDQGYDWYAGI